MGKCVLNGIVGQSCGRAACVFMILQPVHCTICFILKREDAGRFVVIYIKRVMGDPCGFKWGCPAVRNYVSRSLAATIWRSNMAK